MRYTSSLNKAALLSLPKRVWQGQRNARWTVRYRGQGYELNVPYHPDSSMSSVEAFHRAHQQRYGFSDVERPVEIVNLRLQMIAAGERYVPARRTPLRGDGRAACYAERDVFFDGHFIQARFYKRDALVPGDAVLGPAMITEYTSATALPPGCRAEVDDTSNLVIDVAEAHT